MRNVLIRGFRDKVAVRGNGLHQDVAARDGQVTLIFSEGSVISMRRNDERWSVKPIAKGAAALSISAALSGEGEEATLQGDVFWVASVEPIVVQKGAQ